MRADSRLPGGREALAALAAMVWIAGAAPAWAQRGSDVDAAVAAATEAVRDCFGRDAEVTLSGPLLSHAGGAASAARAVAEPSSRTAGLVRFVLYAAGAGTPQRVGRLTARVDVRAPHLRMRGRVAAREPLTSADVTVVHGDIGRQAFEPLPTIDALAGAMTRQALLEGQVVTPRVLTTRALVTSGDEVVTVARVGAIEVRGRAIAAQSGKLGETVIVVNPDSRKRLRARVVADARVEVLLGS